MTETDRELLEQLIDEIDNHKPWLWEGSIWKTESSYWSWFRGSLRSIWSRKWVFKNNYLKEHSFPAPVLDKEGNPTIFKTGKKRGQPKTTKHFKCEITGEVLPIKQGQVDHISPAGSCNSGITACTFLFRLLTSPDNMRLISKEAHAIVTHMEKKGITWDEAVAEKKVIAVMKTSVPNQKKLLMEYDYDGPVNNTASRKKAFKEIFST